MRFFFTSLNAIEDGTPQPIYGCTDPTANNYNPNATVDNGSCEYDSGEEIGYFTFPFTFPITFGSDEDTTAPDTPTLIEVT